MAEPGERLHAGALDTGDGQSFRELVELADGLDGESEMVEAGTTRIEALAADVPMLLKAERDSPGQLHDLLGVERGPVESIDVDRQTPGFDRDRSPTATRVCLSLIHI